MSRNKNLQNFFSDSGPLAKSLPGYHRRPQQAQASAVVAKAMRKKGGIALVEAATGVGKTLAYLLPALHHADPEHKIIVSTHSLALQAQLIERDIPFVQSISPTPLNGAVLKGRGNYLCLQDYEVGRKELWSVGDPQFEQIGEWSRTTKTGDVVELPFSYQGWGDVRANTDTCKGRECRYFDRCFYYDARRNAQDASIIIVNHALFFSDLAMRRLGEEGSLLPDYSFVVFDEAHHLETAAAGAFGVACNSGRVPSLVEKFRRLARHADIDRDRLKALEAANEAIFGPLAMLGRQEFTLDDTLPGYQLMSARTALAELSTQLDSAAVGLLKVDHGGNQPLRDRIDGLRRLCGRTKEELTLIFTGDDPNYLRWGSVNRGMRRGTVVTVNWTPISVAPILSKVLWDPPRETGAALISATLATDSGFHYLRQRLGIPEALVDEYKRPHPNPPLGKGREQEAPTKSVSMSATGTALPLGERTGVAVVGSAEDSSMPTPDTRSAWWEEEPGSAVPLEPAEGGGTFDSLLSEGQPLRQPMTSDVASEGSLETSRASHPIISGEQRHNGDESAKSPLPIDPDPIYELIVGSPFDFERQALLYVPKGIPPPGDDAGYVYALVNEIVALIDASRGGAFLLFTSYRTLNAAYDKLAASESAYRILRQGDMPNARLVEAFKEEANTVLLGTQSFWEGVDIPGDALRLVVIDKLPFATPDSPLHKARVAQITASGGDWFNDYALPQAQLKLKQGFGRLIRTSTDRGVVALMDSRIRTKGYGRRILASLPPARQTASIEDVIAFYGNGPVVEATNDAAKVMKTDDDLDPF